MRCRVGLDRHGNRAHVGYGKPGRDIGVRRDDDFVTLPDVERAQGQGERVEPVAKPHAMLRFAKLRPLALEAFHFGTEDIPAALEHTRDRGIDFGLQFAISRAEVEKGDHCSCASTSARNVS